MRMLTVASVVVVLAGAAVLAQGRLSDSAPGRTDRRSHELMALPGRGAEIGVSIADPTSAGAGVVVEEVRPDSPAEKAGLKRSDVIVEFDGERVRSARQFGRLVQETPPGRSVKATVMRDGQKKEVEITPVEGRGARAEMFIDGDQLRDHLAPLENLREYLPPNFDFDFDMPGALSGRRLGVTVDELTDQLAQYFGAKDGLLVTSVTDGSAASRAGLKAGDVITSIDGRAVRSTAEMVRALREAPEDEITIGIVRDKRESSVKAKIEAPARRNLRGGRPA